MKWILLVAGIGGVVIGCIVCGYGAVKAVKSSYADLGAAELCCIGALITNFSAIIAILLGHVCF